MAALVDLTQENNLLPPPPPRRNLGIHYEEHVTNGELYYRAQIPSMLNIIRRHRLTWLGHIGRMSDERLVKRLLFGQLSGTRRQGRPRSTLRSVFRDDFLSISGAVTGNRPWLVLCQDRRLWRDLVAIGTAPPPAPPDQAPYQARWRVYGFRSCSLIFVTLCLTIIVGLAAGQLILSQAV